MVNLINHCWLSETQRETPDGWSWSDFGEPYFSGLLDILPHCSIWIIDWKLTFADGAGQQQRWCQQTMDHLYLSQQYTEISLRFSAKPRLRQPHCISQWAMQLTWIPATISAMSGFPIDQSGFEQSGVEWNSEGSGINAIRWNMIMCSRGWICHLELFLKIPCHMEELMCG